MTRGTITTVGLARLAIVLAALLSAVPAAAQVDLTGTWTRRAANDNGASNEPVDLMGIPVSADGRAKALSYDIAALSATERQCQMYTPWYALFGPFPLQIVPVPDPVTQKLVAWRIEGWIDRDVTIIWMDGRPRPSEFAPHSHAGFTSGWWEGDALMAVQTHFKMGDMKRHRAISSDLATLTYRFRRHGDLMTVTGILEDPAYLAEPWVLTEIFELTSNPQTFPLTACEPIEELPILHEDPTHVPHYLPGQNPWINEVTEKYGVPVEAVMGGPETTYPEYRTRLQELLAVVRSFNQGLADPPTAGGDHRAARGGRVPGRGRPRE